MYFINFDFFKKNQLKVAKTNNSFPKTKRAVFFGNKKKLQHLVIVPVTVTVTAGKV